MCWIGQLKRAAPASEFFMEVTTTSTMAVAIQLLVAASALRRTAAMAMVLA